MPWNRAEQYLRGRIAAAPIVWDGFSMALLIEDYGLLGDTQTAALVERDGSID